MPHREPLARINLWCGIIKKKTVRLIEVVLHILDSAGLGCVYVWYRSAQSFSVTPHFHASHVNQTGGTLNSHP